MNFLNDEMPIVSVAQGSGAGLGLWVMAEFPEVGAELSDLLFLGYTYNTNTLRCNIEQYLRDYAYAHKLVGNYAQVATTEKMVTGKVTAQQFVLTYIPDVTPPYYDEVLLGYRNKRKRYEGNDAYGCLEPISGSGDCFIPLLQGIETANIIDHAIGNPILLVPRYPKIKTAKYGVVNNFFARSYYNEVTYYCGCRSSVTMPITERSNQHTIPLSTLLIGAGYDDNTIRVKLHGETAYNQVSFTHNGDIDAFRAMCLSCITFASEGVVEGFVSNCVEPNIKHYFIDGGQNPATAIHLSDEQWYGIIDRYASWSAINGDVAKIERIHNVTNEGAYCNIAVLDECPGRYYLQWQDRWCGVQSQPFDAMEKYAEDFNHIHSANASGKKVKIATDITPKITINTKNVTEDELPIYEGIYLSRYIILYDTLLDESYNVVVTDTTYEEHTYKNNKRMFNVKLNLEFANREIML